MKPTKKIKPRYKYQGYLAFRVMADLHQQLFPKEKSINGGSRKASKIFAALSAAYTDGLEDAAQMEPARLQMIRGRIARSCREVDI